MRGEPKKGAGGVNPTPKLWVVSASFGNPSEVWMLRQVQGFQQVIPRFVAWQRGELAHEAPASLEVHWLPKPRGGASRSGRWWGYLRGLPTRNCYASYGAHRRKLAQLVRTAPPDVVLAHFGKAVLAVLPVMRAAGVPLVAHFHGHDLSSQLKSRWYRWSLLRNLRRFAAIVVVGTHQYAWMVAHGAPRDKLHLIPCGVPTMEFRPAEWHGNGRFRFAAVSRLVPGKGVGYTLRAFAQVARSHSDVELRVLGDGPEIASLQALAFELGIAGAVSFDGFVPSAKVRDVLGTAHAFVQHSIEDETGSIEGFGVSLAEAAASGLPVVATRLGGIPDQVVDGETGFLVPQRDVKAMADRMRRLVDDRDLARRMGQAGRQRMVEHFDTTKQIAKLEDVLLRAARLEKL